MHIFSDGAYVNNTLVSDATETWTASYEKLVYKSLFMFARRKAVAFVGSLLPKTVFKIKPVRKQSLPLTLLTRGPGCW